MSTSIMSNAKLQDDMSSIPLADDDPQGIDELLLKNWLDLICIFVSSSIQFMVKWVLMSLGLFFQNFHFIL